MRTMTSDIVKKYELPITNWLKINFPYTGTYYMGCYPYKNRDIRTQQHMYQFNEFTNKTYANKQLELKGQIRRNLCQI